MFWNLLKKELREVLTVSSVISIVAMALIYAMIGKSVGSMAEEVSKKPTVAVVNLDKGEFSEAIEDAVESYAKVIYKGDNVDEAMEKLKKNNGSALLIVQEDFSEELASNQQAKVKVVSILKGLGIMDTIPSEAFKSFLDTLKHQMTLTLLTKYGVENPSFVLDPIDREEATMYSNKVLEGMSPSQLLNYVSNRWLIVSIVVMMLIIMSGSTVISSLGLEKENKTLETLLTMPVARSHIILAKILAATIAGLVMAGIYMVGISLYMRSFDIPLSSGIDFSMNVADFALVALTMFSALLCGISLAMLLGFDFERLQECADADLSTRCTRYLQHALDHVQRSFDDATSSENRHLCDSFHPRDDFGEERSVRQLFLVDLRQSLQLCPRRRSVGYQREDLQQRQSHNWGEIRQKGFDPQAHFTLIN